MEGRAKDLKAKRIKRAHDYLLTLGRVVVGFSDVKREPRYPDGERETDVEHSFHLAFSAIELAADFYPKLDVGLVSQFSLVHDLPELYSGDVWTFNISAEDRAKKEAAEAEATRRLLGELPPHIAQLLKRYESQQEPEARFVRFVDKLLPAIINIMAGDATTFKEDHGIFTIEQLNADRDKRNAWLLAMFPEFDAIHLVRELISKTSAESVFGVRPND